MIPFLGTIAVPSPTGTGNSTATINYSAGTDAVSSLVDADGNSRNYVPFDALRTEVTVEDPHGNVIYQTIVRYDSAMHPTDITDASNSHVYWTAVYADPNDPDRPSLIRDGGVGDGSVKTTSMAWDQYGHLTSVTTARGTAVVYTWDYSTFALGELTKVQEGSKTPTTLSYFEPSGLVRQINTPTPGTAGSMTTVASSFTYDSLGNVLTATGPGNNAATTISTSFNYTTDGGYSQAAAIGQPLTATDNLGKVTHFRYSRQGRLISATDALGNERTVSYNIAGQPVLTSAPKTGQTGLGCGAAADYYLYPGGPLGAIKQFDEAGNATRQATMVYGAEGELLSRSGNVEPVTVAYDAVMRIVSLKDGKNQSTAYSYGGTGYLSSVTLPGGETVQYPSYDNHGRLLQRVDGRSVVTNYVYSDTAGRLSDIQYPATPSANIHFNYDGYGRVSSVTDGTGSRSYVYDDLNNPTSITTTYTGVPAKTISYSFYPDGSRQSMSTPAGNFSYLYEGDGRLASLTNSNSETSSWSYLDNGWLSTQQLANGATTTYTRNATGTLTDLTNKANGGALLSEFGSLAYL